MAGTAKTDLLAVVFSANDKANAPLGFDLQQNQEVALNKLKDAQIAVQKLKDYATDAGTKAALDTVLTDLT